MKNVMYFTFAFVLAVALVLNLAGCGSSGSGANPANTSASNSTPNPTDSQNVDALNQLPVRQGLFDVFLNVVSQAEVFSLGFLDPQLSSLGVSYDAGAAVPVFPSIVLIEGSGILDPSGVYEPGTSASSNLPVINGLAIHVAYEENIKLGQDCLAAAEKAHANNQSVEIKGQGILVPIVPIFICPDNAMCAPPPVCDPAPGYACPMVNSDPAAPSSGDVANEIVSSSASLAAAAAGSSSNLPLFVRPEIGIYFQELDSCQSPAILPPVVKVNCDPIPANCHYTDGTATSCGTLVCTVSTTYNWKLGTCGQQGDTFIPCPNVIGCEDNLGNLVDSSLCGPPPG